MKQTHQQEQARCQTISKQPSTGNIQNIKSRKQGKIKNQKSNHFIQRLGKTGKCRLSIAFQRVGVRVPVYRGWVCKWKQYSGEGEIRFPDCRNWIIYLVALYSYNQVISNKTPSSSQTSPLTLHASCACLFLNICLTKSFSIILALKYTMYIFLNFNVTPWL